MTIKKYTVFYLAYEIGLGVYLLQTQLQVHHKYFVAMIILLNGVEKGTQVMSLRTP